MILEAGSSKIQVLVDPEVAKDSDLAPRQSPFVTQLAERRVLPGLL